MYFSYADFITTSTIYALLLIIIFYLKKKKVLGSRVFLFCFSFFISFYLAEFFLRYIYKYPLSYNEQNGKIYASASKGLWLENFSLRKEGYRKNLHTLEFRPFEDRSIASCENISMPIETYNKFGMRGNIPDLNKKTVVTFGDSFTEGACVSWGKSYPKALENKLLGIDSNFAVLNAGISGNDPFFDWKMLRRLKDSLKIYTAVFLINSTDISDIMIRGGNERFLLNGDIKYIDTPWWERVYAFSLVFRLMIHNVWDYDRNLMTHKERERREKIAFENLKNLFHKDIIPFCFERNIKLIIAIHPLEWELNDKLNYNVLISSFHQTDNAIVIDTYNPIYENNKKSSIYLAIDKHFNEKGSEIIADEIFNVLKPLTYSD